MLEVKAGNMDKLIDLFDRYQTPLLNFFLRLSGDYETSQDLTQNVFIRIMKSKHTYRGEHKFKTWIYQVARNLFYDHYRKEVKPKVAFMHVEGEVYAHADESESQEIEEKEEKIRLALNQLPADKREVLVLSRYQGLKYEQIAEITGTSVSNVKIRAHRAINTLRGIYFKWHSNELQRLERDNTSLFNGRTG